MKQEITTQDNNQKDASTEVAKTPVEPTQEQCSSTECRPRHRVAPVWSASRKDDAYELKVELPGVSKDQVKLRQEKQILSLEADREAPDDSLELVAGSAPSEGYELKVKLPNEIDPKKLQGSLNNGVLSVVLPVRSDELPREIPLN